MTWREHDDIRPLASESPFETPRMCCKDCGGEMPHRYCSPGLIGGLLCKLGYHLMDDYVGPCQRNCGYVRWNARVGNIALNYTGPRTIREGLPEMGGLPAAEYDLARRDPPHGY